MNYYNAVRHDNPGDDRAAIIGGPYSNLEAAKRGLVADQRTAENHAKNGAKASAFGHWVAVQLAEAVTLRDKALGASGAITVVRIGR